MNYAAPRSINEEGRLARLRALQVLDSEPEPIFDALTRTASAICNAPIALLSLVSADRQWFKSNIGLEGTAETSREVAFCAHAILGTDLMEVPDAMEDPRFCLNPLVIGQPHIRFYAGAPVVMSEGESVGTLCVIDTQPRVLNDVQRKVLSDLALVASKALDMRQRALELDQLHARTAEKAQEISTQEALYHAIVEDQTDLVSLSLPSGELTYVNEAYAKHFALTPKDMVGRNLFDYVSVKDRDAVASHLQKLCEGPGVAYGENQMRSAKGEERWMAWSNRSIGDENDHVISLHSVGRDITDRKQAEFALKASQNRLRALYESTPAMLHSIDRQGRILYVSDMWLRSLGYTREEVVGKRSTDFLTPASRDYATNDVLPNFFESGRIEDIEYQMVRKDGTVIDIVMSAILERDSSGQPEHSLAIIQDVTEKKAMSAALIAKEERLSLATSVNGIGIWEVDLKTGKVEWTDTMFEIFGSTPASFGGTLEDWSSKLHPKDYQRSVTEFQKAIETYQPIDFDFRVLTDNGEIRHVHARAEVIRDEHGNATRVLGTNYDVSERKEVERALARSERRLRLIANNLPVLISHVDMDYRYTFTNDKYQTWFHLKEGSTVGKTVAEVFGEEVFAGVKSYMAEAMTGKDVSFELTNTIPGSPTNLYVHYVPDRDAQGTVTGIFGMVLDRTEQHQAQARLEASERQLRAVTDNLPVLIAYVDTEERLQFLNATFKDWLGIDLQWATGRSIHEVLGDVRYEKRRDALRKALAGERIEFDSEINEKGVHRYLRTIFIPDVWPDGVAHGAYVLSLDVTDVKRVEKELQDIARIDPRGYQTGGSLMRSLGKPLHAANAPVHVWLSCTWILITSNPSMTLTGMA
ncbi:PAS domain S-box protein [Rhodoferax sp. GW822-FHT02A01]|uniref:PAS domain S-box protein n=1 Tax=Rhodoferax sp. GW822-FHT02A01 TaxID=3141537 RepID=UPI00315CBA94